MKEPIRDRIASGVKNIKGNEVVPEVPFTVVLERFGKKMRGRFRIKAVEAADHPDALEQTGPISVRRSG